MKFEWRDYNEGGQRPESSAIVNAIVLRAREVDGAWRAWVSVGGLRVLSEDHCASREEAKAAAEEMLRELVAPFVKAAVEAERESCALIASLIEQRERRSGVGWDAAQEIEDAIRARGPRSSDTAPHRDALAALRALGVAVATVARARLVSRVAEGRSIRHEVSADRMLELWWHGWELCLSEYQHQRTPRRLRTFDGHPEDVAAEAVARLIEEVDR